MRRLGLVLALSAVIGATASAAPPAASAANCGTRAGQGYWYNIQTDRMACPPAERKLRRFFSNSNIGKHWRCEYRSVGKCVKFKDGRTVKGFRFWARG